MVNTKDYSLKDLQGALKNLKKTSMFNGKVSGLNKSKIISILNDWNFDFTQLGLKAKRSRATKMTVPYRKYGSIKKAVERHQNEGSTQLEKAIKAEKTKRSKKIGPSLPRGMTYKGLYQSYLNDGNKELEGKIINMSRKGPGRPKGSKNKKKLINR